MSTAPVVKIAGTGAAAATWTTASYTPAANSRDVAFIGVAKSSATPAAPTIFDSAGNNWTFLAKMETTTFANPALRGDWYISDDVGGSPAARTVTVASTGAQSVCVAIADVLTADVSGSLAQAAVGGEDLANGDPSCTFGSAPGASNITLLGAFFGGGNLGTKPTGWTSFASAVIGVRAIAASYDVTSAAQGPNQYTSLNTRSIILGIELAPAATGSSVGTASGIGAAAGTGASTAETTASAAGVGSAAASGASTVSSAGTSAGTGAASGIGASTSSSVGSSAGVGAAAAVGASASASVGSAAGTSTVAGVGASSSSGSVGTATGTGTASGVGASVVASIGQASGASTANGVGSGSQPEITHFGGGGFPLTDQHVRDLRAATQRQRDHQDRTDAQKRRDAAELRKALERAWEDIKEEAPAVFVEAAPEVNFERKKVDWSPLVRDHDAVLRVLDDVKAKLASISRESQRKAAREQAAILAGIELQRLADDEEAVALIFLAA